MEKVQHIFQNISKAEWSRMMVCFHASEKWYKTGERVCSYDENNEQIGIVMEGTVQLVRTHTDGRQTILEQLEPGSLFGEPLSYTAFSGGSLQVYSLKDSKVLYMNYSHLIKRCSKACAFHSQLVNNALQIIAQKSVQLSKRLEVLSQRTIRDKLLCYFSLLSAQNQSQVFTLPFSYSSLADYLSVDRSAMMRELKKMKDEGILKTDKHEITLLSEGLYL